MRKLFIVLLLGISACSYIDEAHRKSELSGAINGTEANSRSRNGTPNYLYGSSSTDDDLAQSSLNNNINNTSAVHPYHNVYPSHLTPKEPVNAN